MMLRPRAPLRSNHLCLSDSETESDDLNEHLKVQDRKKNSTGVYDGKENCMYKKNKKRETVNEDHMKSLMDESGKNILNSINSPFCLSSLFKTLS